MSHVTSRNDFYKDLRPMLIVYKIMGLTRLKNVFSGPVEFQFGLNFLWPLLMCIVQCYIVWFINVEKTKLIIWFWIVNFFMYEFLNQLSWMYIDTRLPKIIEKINRFDEKFGRPMKHKILFPYLVIVYVGCVLSLLIYLCRSILYNRISIVTIEMDLRSLRMRWRNKVSKIHLSNSRTTCRGLELERLAHAQLCELVEELSVTFGPQLTSYMFFTIIEQLAQFYCMIDLIPHQSKHTEIENMWIICINTILFLARAWIGIFMIAYFSESLTESSKEIITDLRNIPILNLPYDYCEQIKIFISQVQNSQTIITASGLFTINKTILSSTFISLVTYMIAIVQFFPNLERIFDE